MSNFGDQGDWDEFARRCANDDYYGTTPIRNPIHVLDFMRTIAPSTGNLLDCGCGIGRWSGFFAKNGYTCVGIDQSPVAIEIGRRLFTNVEFKQMFLWDLAFTNEFDIVVSITALQHNFYEDRKKIIEKIGTALRVNGTFLMIEEGEKPDDIDINWTTVVEFGSGNALRFDSSKLNWYLFRKQR